MNHHDSYPTHFHNLQPVERLTRGVLGAALIAPVYLTSGALGWHALLPLIATYLLITAGWGWDPLHALNVHMSEKSSGDRKIKLGTKPL